MTSQPITKRIKNQKKKIANATKYFETINPVLDDLYNEILEWRKISNCSAPIPLKLKLTSLESKLDNKAKTIKELNKEIRAWKKVTGCKSPEEVEMLIVSLQTENIKEMCNDSLGKTYIWELNG